jgi:hypothetical protein
MNTIESVSRDDPRITKKLSKHKAFWEMAKENSLIRSVGVFAPSLPVGLPQADGSKITHAESLTPDMIDPEAMVAEVKGWVDGTPEMHVYAQWQSVAAVGLGDLLPICQPFFKIPWLEAILGCPITMTEGQIWNEHHPNVDQVLKQGGNIEHNPWLELYREFLRQMRIGLADRFPVSTNTLFRGPCDLVAAVYGVQEACIGWVAEPELMAKLLRVCTDVHLAVVEAGYELLKPVDDGPADGGYMSGFGIWSPGPVTRMQADHSTLLSPDMYKQQILPFDREIINACPHCIFHLHNAGLHVAPVLLEVEELDIIEVVVDPYPDTERKQYEMDMYRKILGQKPLILDANFPSLEEANWVVSELPNQGLNVNARFDPEIIGDIPDDTPGNEMYSLC